MKKYHFFQHSIVFLGYVLFVDGISANPEKVDNIKNWLVLTNPKWVWTFLGSASYYCQFIPMCAAIAKCLLPVSGSNKWKMNPWQPRIRKISHVPVNTKWHLTSWNPTWQVHLCWATRFQSTIQISEWSILTRIGCHTITKGWKWHKSCGQVSNWCKIIAQQN